MKCVQAGRAAASLRCGKRKRKHAVGAKRGRGGTERERCILYFSCPALRGYTRPHANTRNTSTSYPMECSFTELQLHQKDIIMGWTQSKKMWPQNVVICEREGFLHKPLPGRPQLLPPQEKPRTTLTEASSGPSLYCWNLFSIGQRSVNCCQGLWRACPGDVPWGIKNILNNFPPPDTQNFIKFLGRSVSELSSSAGKKALLLT